MTTLAVHHRSVYRFDPPIRGLTQSLRLWPSQHEGQRIDEWRVSVAGLEILPSFRDGAGDRIGTASIAGPLDEVEVLVTGRVTVEDLSGVLRGHAEKIPPMAYLSPTALTRPDADLRAFATAAVAEADEGLDRAHTLARAVTDAVAYVPGETGEGTTAVEALAAGRGVCQDHAHVLIAAARSLSMPARYVTGYLNVIAGGASAEASHAWAEIWVRDLGWVGFDASNGVSPDGNYIRLGSGGDAIEAAPIRGVSEGVGTETLEVSVDVGQAQQ